MIAPLAFPEWRPIEHSVFAPRAIPLAGPWWTSLFGPVIDRPMLEIHHRIMFAPDAPSEAWKRHYPWDMILDPAASIANGEDFLAANPSRPDSHVDLAAIRIPVQILSGSADLIIEEGRQAVPLAARLANATHHRLPGVGHMLHHSRGDAVVEAVRRAVAQVESR